MQTVVDLSRLRHNIRIIRSKLGVGFCAVVKAQAYGHGIAVAPYIEPVVDCFMVATYSEARQAVCTGITKPVLVMGGELPRVGQFDSQIIPAVSNVRDLEYVVANGYGKFSIAVNTGMNRLGADSEELARMTEACRRLGVRAWSVYSHIYGGMYSTAEQAVLFDSMTRNDVLSERRHLYSSCALDVADNDLFDMTRCGIAMYGYADGLTPAMTVRASIVGISSVCKGSHIGYGDYILDRDATVATVRCGYADGLRRTNRPMYFTVRGKKCRVLGMPCMDLCMIDVTGLQCRIGEYAYLIKSKEDTEYLAKIYDTIIYEVLTGFNGRAERIYI